MNHAEKTIMSYAACSKANSLMSNHQLTFEFSQLIYRTSYLSKITYVVWVMALLILFCPFVTWAQVDAAKPGRIPLTGFDDVPYGYLELGKSKPDDARHVMRDYGGLGPKRFNNNTFTIGGIKMQPIALYNPSGTMNQLYFDNNDILVMVVEGIPRGLPATRSEFMKRYPNAHVTHQESGWYEMQTQLTECEWLVAVFRSEDDSLESNAYAYICNN